MIPLFTWGTKQIKFTNPLLLTRYACLTKYLCLFCISFHLHILLLLIFLSLKFIVGFSTQLNWEFFLFFQEVTAYFKLNIKALRLFFQNRKSVSEEFQLSTNNNLRLLLPSLFDFSIQTSKFSAFKTDF